MGGKPTQTQTQTQNFNRHSASNNSYTGATSNTTNAIISDDWLNQNQSLAEQLGNSGMTGAQQYNADALRNVGAGQGLYTNAGYYGLDQFNQRFGGGWATPADLASQNVTASMINAPSIAAQSGAQNMSAYQNPWDRDVIDASVADYNVNADRALNAMRAGRDASGAFGDRSAIADAVYQADATRGLGSLVSGLRQQGFNTAAAYGQQDASRVLNADQTNAANSLAAQQANAANSLAAQQFNSTQALNAGQFNNTLRNERQQFDINTALQGDQNRMQAFRDMQNNIQAQNAIQSSGIDNLIKQLNLGTATFGSQSDGTASGTSESTGHEWGDSSGTTTSSTGGGKGGLGTIMNIASLVAKSQGIPIR